MTSKSKKPLPLSDILRDLALLRASSHDIPEIFKQSCDIIPPTSESHSVTASYNYVSTIRAAIKLNDSGKLETEGQRIEDVRNKCEELDVCYVAFLLCYMLSRCTSPYWSNTCPIARVQFRCNLLLSLFL